MRCERLLGVTVALRVNDKDLTEYNTTPDEHLASISAYVESSPGMTFSVEIVFEAGFPHHKSAIAIDIELDGVATCETVEKVRPSKKAHSFSIAGPRSVVNGVHSIQKYTFADLIISDDTPRKEDFESLKHLGEVRVTLKRCCITSTKKAKSGLAGSSFTGNVPEKALKGRAISTRTQLATPEKTAEYDVVDVTYPDGDVPLGVFAFRYRTYRDLQAEGIIPRTPQPTPLEDRDPSSLSHEEALELVQRLKTREAEALQEKLRMKREKAKKRGHTAISGSNDGDDEIVVTETSDRAKRSKAAGVIDLSDE